MPVHWFAPRAETTNNGESTLVTFKSPSRPLNSSQSTQLTEASIDDKTLSSGQKRWLPSPVFSTE